MPGKIAPAAALVNASDSHPAQLRLPLMARTDADGLPTANPFEVEILRRFLVKHSAATAKDVALATGARSSRVHNEDEGRVLLSFGTALARFMALPARDQKRVINELCVLAGLPLYAAGERSLDDSFAEAR